MILFFPKNKLSRLVNVSIFSIACENQDKAAVTGEGKGPAPSGEPTKLRAMSSRNYPLWDRKQICLTYERVYINEYRCFLFFYKNKTQ